MALDDEPTSVEQLRDITGRMKSNIYESLKILGKNNIAVKDGKNWVRRKVDLHDLLEKYQCAEST